MKADRRVAVMRDNEPVYFCLGTQLEFRGYAFSGVHIVFTARETFGGKYSYQKPWFRFRHSFVM
ncbi:hypothetical protein [Sphingobacterium nematocida]|uniref:hypothetical protein n=1 Tax=Sphingobacterium nematocida TaxID=1513896 RepID=UPI001117540C|nr:hypothetical protein [Sphingobacterium nematocida]